MCKNFLYPKKMKSVSNVILRVYSRGTISQIYLSFNRDNCNGNYPPWWFHRKFRNRTRRTANVAFDSPIPSPSSECGRPHERALSRRRRTESLGAKCPRERKGTVEHVAVRDKQFFCALLFVFPLNYRHYVDTGYITDADADHEIY